MVKTKLFKVFAILLVLVFVLSACSSSDKDTKSNSSSQDNSDTKSSSTNNQSTTEPSNDENKGDSSKNDAGTNNPAKTDDSSKESVKDLGDLDSDTLKPLPEEKSPSMYYYNANDITDETFFPDQEELLGKPFVFNGTVLEQYDSIVDYLPMNEYGKEISGLDTASVSYKVMTKYGPVIIIDTTPYCIKYIKDSLDSNVMGIKYFKCWYNDLAAYKKMPEIGDSARFYGFYYGYSAEDECPVFTYGVSCLAHDGFFMQDYLVNRSDEVKKAKFRNLITFQYPVGWSETLDNAGQMEIYFPQTKGVFIIEDFELDDMSVDDVIKMFTGEDMFSMPEDMPDMPEGEDMPQFDISDYLKVHEKEKVAIGDGSISAYKLNISTKSQNETWIDEIVYAFQAKRSVMVLQFAFYDQTDFDTDTDDLDVDIDYSGENEESQTDDGSSDENEELDINGVIKQEIAKVIKSIEICGF